MNLRFIILLTALHVSVAAVASAQYHSEPLPTSRIAEAPYRYTGLIINDISTGSGAVIKNPKVALSAAHVVFDDLTVGDPWITNNYWYGKWHHGAIPEDYSGTPLRGFFHFSSYAPNALSLGLNSLQTFNVDFVAHYSYEDLADGGSANAWSDGGSALQSKNSKVITGYPAGLYSYQDFRRYLMHQTGPFPTPLYRIFDNYYEHNNLSTGPGNSGGPVWVASGDQHLIAGILIAGLEKQTGGGIDVIGVRAIDKEVLRLIDQASTQLSGLGFSTPLASSAPKILVSGNSGPIISGTQTTSALNHTFLGITSKKSAKVRRGFVVTNEGEETLSLTGKHPVSLTGRQKRFFKVTKQPKRSLTSLQSTDFKVQFQASRRGIYRTNVVIKSDDPRQKIYTFEIDAERQ